jgi:glycosyltransferase involved in cell wall biosynthesis
VTIYDMIPERYFSLCGDWAKSEIERKTPCILAADLCVCISHATARDLIAFFPEVEHKVRVVHLAGDHVPQRQRVPFTPRDRPFALYVGQRGHYKNFALVLDAMRRPEWPRPMRLQVVGDPFDTRETALLRATALSSRIVNLGPLDEQSLQEQFESASCLILPSLNEGFGLPILEAQICGCPVLASDAPVFHEVAGGGALFFAHNDSKGLAQTVSTVLDDSLASALRAAGYRNAARFSWAKTAEQLLEVYEEGVRLSRAR